MKGNFIYNNDDNDDDDDDFAEDDDYNRVSLPLLNKLFGPDS